MIPFTPATRRRARARALVATRPLSPAGLPKGPTRRSISRSPPGALAPPAIPAVDLRWDRPEHRRARMCRQMPEFSYTDLLPLGEDTTDYRLVAADGLTRRHAFGKNFLEVDPGVLTLLTQTAMRDIAHLLR